MKLNKTITHLICDLETIIGLQTYNPNSYNGWTGEEGCEYKYPISYCENKKALKEERLTKGYTISDITPDCVKTMKYVFGSNHLYIGDGIVKMLEFLEDKYDIDFNELENLRMQKCKEKIYAIQKELETGKELLISNDCLKVGEDIPEGKYILLKDGEYDYLSADIFNSKGKQIRDIFTKSMQVKITLKAGHEIHLYKKVKLKLRND